MERNNFIEMDPCKFPSPSFIVDVQALKSNLEVLDCLRKASGCRILLAQKGFAMFSLYPLLKKHLDGVCASGLNEARLGYEEFGKEVHTYSPAFIEQDFDSILKYSNHIVFNSFSQLNKYRDKVLAAGKIIGMRINPEHRETDVEIYDPCRTGSRLGVVRENFEENNLDGVTGLHFHTLCEKNSDSLERTLKAAEEKFEKDMRRSPACTNWPSSTSIFDTVPEPFAMTVTALSDSTVPVSSTSRKTSLNETSASTTSSPAEK